MTDAAEAPALAGARGEPAPRPLLERRFGWFVAAAVAVGAVIRVWNAATLPAPAIVSDPDYYHVQANLLAKGHGFADPFLWLDSGRLAPTAVHPPLFPLLLSVTSRFGGTSVLAHRLSSGAIGLVTIVAVALLARAIAGPAVGVTAAVMAALYPNFWGLEGSLFSEGLAAALVALALLFALRVFRRPTTRDVALLALCLALAALTRPETLLLVPLLAVVVIVKSPRIEPKRRMPYVVLLVAIVAVVLAPWLVRNLTGFSRPVYFSTNGDEVIGVANCQPTYYNPQFLGYWSFVCNGHNTITDDAKRSALERARGLRYMRTHLDRFLGTVVPARLGRVWDVYRPFDNARYSALEGRHLDAAYAGLWSYWFGMVLAAFGARVLWRRQRAELLQLLAPAVVVVVTAIYAYGAERFRAVAEPSLVVLAAIGVHELVSIVRSRRNAAAPDVSRVG